MKQKSTDGGQGERAQMKRGGVQKNTVVETRGTEEHRGTGAHLNIVGGQRDIDENRWRAEATEGHTWWTGGHRITQMESRECRRTHMCRVSQKNTNGWQGAQKNTHV